MKYLSIKDACRETGLSQYYLRSGCRNNRIQHIRSGIKILIDVDALEEALAFEAKTIKEGKER